MDKTFLKITNREIYNKLLEIESKLVSIKSRLILVEWISGAAMAVASYTIVFLIKHLMRS